MSDELDFAIAHLIESGGWVGISDGSASARLRIDRQFDEPGVARACYADVHTAYVVEIMHVKAAATALTAGDVETSSAEIDLAIVATNHGTELLAIATCD